MMKKDDSRLKVCDSSTALGGGTNACRETDVTWNRTIAKPFSHEHVELTSDFYAALRVGYLGGSREKFVERMNKLFGAENWTVGYVFHGSPISRDEALSLYQKSYTNYLRSNPDFTARMLQEACDVYDTNVSNIQSGLDWHHQEDSRSHLQDIAVRRAVSELGLSFTGTRLMQIRGRDSDLAELNPGRIPFILPDHIVTPRVYSAPWIELGSLEDFWQNNKFVFVKSSDELMGRLQKEVESSISRKRREDFKLTSEKLAVLTICGKGDAALTGRFASYIGDLIQLSVTKGTVSISDRFLEDWFGKILVDQSNALGSAHLPVKAVLKMFETLRPAIERADPWFTSYYLTEATNRIFPAALVCELARGPFPLSHTGQELLRTFLNDTQLETLERDVTCRAALGSSQLAHLSHEDIRAQVLDHGWLKDHPPESTKQRFLSILSSAAERALQGF